MVAHLDVAGRLHVLEGDRLVDLLLAEVEHDGRPHQLGEGDAGGVAALGEVVERRLDVGAHVRPEVDGAHDVALVAVALVVAPDVEDVLLAAGVEGVGQVDDAPLGE
jgi:hypothetical protein